MNKLHKYIVFISCFLCLIAINAQDTIKKTNTPTVVVKAKAKKDKIMLRWGVNNKFAWLYGTKYGYTIERTTILRDGQPLNKTEKIILTNGVIKPKPPESWRALVEKNDNAAVVAQAMFGEDFEMNDNTESNKMLKVIQENEELDRRFAFAMFAIDQDFEVAQYAGLGYIDNNVKSNEKYLYNIKANVPTDILKIEYSGVFISPSEEEPLPKPKDFVGYYYKNSFVLIWEYESMLPYYTSYNLEKSLDGKNFEKVNKVPITKLADNKSTGISFTDSVTVFNKHYWYRLKGISVFNEISEPTKAVKLYAYRGISAAPFFKDNVILSEKEVVFEWTFPAEQESELKHFDLLRADVATGPYQTVKKAIPANSRSYKYTDLKRINYFKLKAVSKNGQNTLSPSNMVQPIDSVPPVKPLNLQGSIDTLGIVTLTWNANTEKDLKGYKIWRADRPNQEFSVLNKHEEKTTSYKDSINLLTFSKKVYYKIAAIDTHYNQSEYSDIIVLKRPDKIPPTSPVFDSYEQKDNTIILKWVKSSSDDVASEAIYRKASNSNNELWEKVYETKSDTTAYYKDVKINPGIKYVYTLVAIDKSGLESPPSPPLAIAVIKTLVKPEVKGLYANVNREEKQINLFWRYNETNVQEFLIYKKKKGQQFTLFRTARPNEQQLIDIELSPNTTYYYGIKAIFKDGTVSKWNEIEVIY